jgi:hypothetical protein
VHIVRCPDDTNSEDGTVASGCVALANVVDPELETDGLVLDEDEPQAQRASAATAAVTVSTPRNLMADQSGWGCSKWWNISPFLLWLVVAVPSCPR